MIQIVDRLGKTYKTGDLVYAYFDTSTEKYIVLENYQQPITPMIYGIYQQQAESSPAGGILRVEYAAGIEYCQDGVAKNSDVSVSNKLKIPYTMCGKGTRAIAVRMEVLN